MKFSLNTMLAAAVGALALIILGGTVLALATRHVPGADLRKDDPTPQEREAARGAQDRTAFTELGRLRTATAPDENERRTLIIVTPWLEYTGGDATFYEELSNKLRSVRAIITTYFSGFTKEQLLAQGEQAVKQQLLARINEQLVLGSITAIYFNDYQFLE